MMGKKIRVSCDKCEGEGLLKCVCKGCGDEHFSETCDKCEGGGIIEIDEKDFKRST